MTRSLLALVLLTPVYAQEPDPPPKPLLTVEVAGPAALRTSFLATNLGNLLGSDETKAVWSGILDDIAGVWYRSVGATTEDSFTPFKDRFKAYAGRLRLRGYVLDEKFVGLAELLPDGKVDLAQMQKDLRQLLDNAAAGKAKLEKVGNHLIHRLGRGANSVSYPVLRHGHVVFYLGHLEQAVAIGDRVLAAETAVTPEQNRAAPIRLRLHLDDEARVRAFGECCGSIPQNMVEELIGFSNLRGVELTVRPHGPYVVTGLTLQKKAARAHPGLVGAMLPPTAKPPDVSWIAAGERFFHLDVSYEQMWAELKKYSGALGLDVDLKGGLFDNLHPGFTAIGGLSEPCFVLHVKDADAVRRTLSKLIDPIDPVAGKPLDHNGTTIHVHSYWNDKDAYMAVKGNRLLLAIGDRSLTRLKRVLDSKAQDAKHQDLLRTRAAQPPGCNGVGIASAKHAHLSLLQLMLFDVLGDLEIPFLDKGRFEKLSLVPTLTRHKLKDVVWYTGQDAKALYVRFVW